jgi:hypothetical protein
MGAFGKLLVGTTAALAMFVGLTGGPAWAERSAELVSALGSRVVVRSVGRRVGISGVGGAVTVVATTRHEGQR